MSEYRTNYTVISGHTELYRAIGNAKRAITVYKRELLREGLCHKDLSGSPFRSFAIYWIIFRAPHFREIMRLDLHYIRRPKFKICPTPTSFCLFSFFSSTFFTQKKLYASAGFELVSSEQRAILNLLNYYSYIHSSQKSNSNSIPT